MFYYFQIPTSIIHHFENVIIYASNEFQQTSICNFVFYFTLQSSNQISPLTRCNSANPDVKKSCKPYFVAKSML